jgi:hypothetical protein
MVVNFNYKMFCLLVGWTRGGEITYRMDFCGPIFRKNSYLLQS